MKWLKFSLQLIVVFFSRIGAIGLGIIAGTLLIYVILGYGHEHQFADGSLESRLEGLVSIVFLIGMVCLAIGCTLQQRDLHKVRREVGEVWSRGPHGEV